MDVKMLTKIIKDEKLKNSDQIKIKISFRDPNTEGFKTKVVEAEGYKIDPDGLQIGCYLGYLDDTAEY